MRILFIVQGEGRGHLTQAISLKQKLTSEGHEVAGVLVGKSPARRLPSFFTEKIASPVFSFESPNFLPTAKNKQANLLKSIVYNFTRLHKYIASVLYINHIIKETKADVVVNFYELLTGLTYLFLRPQATMVCIAHQYLFLHPDFVFPKLSPISLASLKFFTRVTAIGSTKKLALSFRKMREVPSEKLIVVPPLLRQEVLDATPHKGNYLHGYLLNSGFSEEIKAWHKEYPQINMHFFWDKKDVPVEMKEDENLTFHQLDDSLFIQYMAGAKAYATTAGFESVCEAMYLNKPVLMVPTHVEQACNAFDASQSGAGAISGQFDLDILLDLSERHTPNKAFPHWVKQADWLIMREFRTDLLMDEMPAPALLHRMLTNWTGRLGRYLPI
ncbi:glycosyltransferase family protein [Parabacteroides bouchesdurhonensis]|uniref:glycosyltransferase family protein n=1 Tax=Parabacteroides bouchesdurhonensis TaxID=1936995 RepID=UPI000E50B869|nr:glycosyltransferase family protein [Parabacteroides bouchesdurhonensis]RHJ93451.1 glycosyltransferase [Bacteroides sp. AM07-16]